MLDPRRLQLPPPSRWEDFEDLCHDLWTLEWKDPSLVRHGRKGQRQDGVDICGKRVGRKEWSGIQCKCKDNLLGSKLTEKELRAEVAKALVFTPKLSEYIVVTTTPRDAVLQKIAREITDDHDAHGLFPVSVLFWDDVQGLLDIHRTVYERHYGKPLNVSASSATEAKYIDLTFDTTHYELMFSRFPPENEYYAGTVLVSCLQNQRCGSFRHGDLYYRLKDVLKLGDFDAFVVTYWINSFKNIDGIFQLKDTDIPFVVPSNEISKFRTDLRETSADSDESA